MPALSAGELRVDEEVGELAGMAVEAMRAHAIAGLPGAEDSREPAADSDSDRTRTRGRTSDSGCTGSGSGTAVDRQGVVAADARVPPLTSSHARRGSARSSSASSRSSCVRRSRDPRPRALARQRACGSRPAAPRAPRSHRPARERAARSSITSSHSRDERGQADQRVVDRRVLVAQQPATACRARAARNDAVGVHRVVPHRQRARRDVRLDRRAGQRQQRAHEVIARLLPWRRAPRARCRARCA